MDQGEQAPERGHRPVERQAPLVVLDEPERDEADEDKDEFRALVTSFLKSSGAADQYLLDPANLYLHPASSEVWRCKICRQPHLHHSGGICTNWGCTPSKRRVRCRAARTLA